MDPSIVFVVPIVAILSGTFYKCLKLFFDAGGNKKDSRYAEALEKRVADLESRVITLQDIVISGDYVTRKMNEQQAYAYQPANSVSNQMNPSAMNSSIE